MNLVNTHNLNRIVNECERSRVLNEFVLIEGPFGQGISTALCHYTSNCNSSVYISWKSEGRTELLALIRAEAKKCARNESSAWQVDPDLSGRSDYDLMNSIAALLTNSQAVLILDHVPAIESMLSLVEDLAGLSYRRFGMVVRFSLTSIRRLMTRRALKGIRCRRPQYVGVFGPSRSEVMVIAPLLGIDDWKSLHLSTRTFSEIFKSSTHV
jgi:hypothetical protein